MSRPSVPIIIAVEFPSSNKKYHYLSEWPDVQIGDTVKTPTGEAKVVGFGRKEDFGFGAKDNNFQLKSIIAWYPQDGRQRKVARQQRIAEIMRELRQTEDNHACILRWRKLARSVPAVKPLLRELEDLLK